MKTNYYAAAYERKTEYPAETPPVMVRDLLAEDGFFRVALCAPACLPGQPLLNAEVQVKAFAEADAQGADLVLFPPLSLVGVSLGDPVSLPSLQEKALKALLKLAEGSRGRFPLLVTSLPVQADGRLIPAAALVRSGSVHAFWELEIPEGRAGLRAYSRRTSREDSFVRLPDNRPVPLISTAAALAEMPALPIFPFSGRQNGRSSGLLGIAYSFTPDLPGGKRETERSLQAVSQREAIAVAYLSPAPGESGGSGIYSGFRALAEAGALLASSPLFEEKMLLQDLDSQFLGALSAKRAEADPFLIPAAEIAAAGQKRTKAGNFRFPEKQEQAQPLVRDLMRQYEQNPFLPSAEEKTDFPEECLLFASRSLAQRMERIHSKHPVLGLSGGLDSCLAQLICLRSLRLLDYSAQDLICVGMPGPGSSHRTKNNAEILARSAGCDYREIPISDAVARHLSAIGHDGLSEDVTFENAQARERTQILMDLANMEEGFVVGTGDLSELALGWCTYNGDQMSMFSVNSTFPKTLVRALCLYEAERLKESAPELAATVLDVLATPVSPELTAGENGEIKQETEAIIGPYELHDFFLYHLLKRSAAPGKILRLACAAFRGSYEPSFIKDTLQIFLRRFIRSQFKRIASPEGVIAGPVSLAPYGWVMPGDLSADVLMAGFEEEKHFYA